jgi:hypothetical protein
MYWPRALSNAYMKYGVLEERKPCWWEELAADLVHPFDWHPRRTGRPSTPPRCMRDALPLVRAHAS